MAEPRPPGSRPIGVALLGSGGSIGTQAVDVLTGLAPDWRVRAIATGSRAALLEEQARRLGAVAAAIASDRPLDLPAGCVQVRGAGALEELATRDDVDLVVVATGGIVSLRPVLAALRAGKIVATANKETLVAGGHLVMAEARARAAGARRDGRGRPARDAARLAAPDRLGALRDLAVPGRRVAGGRRAPRPHRLRRPVPRHAGGRVRDDHGRPTPCAIRPGRWAPRSPSTRRRSPTRVSR